MLRPTVNCLEQCVPAAPFAKGRKPSQISNFYFYRMLIWILRRNRARTVHHLNLCVCPRRHRLKEEGHRKFPISTFNIGNWGFNCVATAPVLCIIRTGSSPRRQRLKEEGHRKCSIFIFNIGNWGLSVSLLRPYCASFELVIARCVSGWRKKDIENFLFYFQYRQLGIICVVIAPVLWIIGDCNCPRC